MVIQHGLVDALIRQSKAAQCERGSEYFLFSHQLCHRRRRLHWSSGAHQGVLTEMHNASWGIAGVNPGAVHPGDGVVDRARA